MDLFGGSDSFRYFKIISVNNKKVKDEGRYKTKASPGDAAKKAFTQLSKKYKTNKLTFSIKETTQGSNKKEHGPYLGEKIKLMKPLTVKYKSKNGKNKPVVIKYETKVHLVKNRKQKGGMDREGDGGGGGNNNNNNNNNRNLEDSPLNNLLRFFKGELRAKKSEHTKFIQDLIVKATNFCIKYPSYNEKCIKILNHAMCIEKKTRYQETCRKKVAKAYDEKKDPEMIKFMENTKRCGNETNLHKCGNYNYDE